MHRRRPWLATRVTVRTTCAPRRPAPSPPRSTGGNGHARRRSMVSLGRGCKPAWTGPTVDCGEDLVAANRWFGTFATAAKANNAGRQSHQSALVYRSQAKAENMRAAYRSAVRASCDSQGSYRSPPPATPPRCRRPTPASAATHPNPQTKHATTMTMLCQNLASVPNDVCYLGERALLLVGFAGAPRRSELASILLRDLDRTAPRPRTDPEADQG